MDSRYPGCSANKKCRLFLHLSCIPLSCFEAHVEDYIKNHGSEKKISVIVEL